MKQSECNFQTFQIKLKDMGRKTFKSDLSEKVYGTGKFFYRLYLNQELCDMTGYRRDLPLYLGKTTDLIDRFYRHFKGMCPELKYSINMEKGRRLYAIMSVHGFNVPSQVLDNLYQYVEFEVDDLTDTNVDLDCYEAEKIKQFKDRQGFLPVLNKREEKTITVNQTLTRKFFEKESV